MTIVLAQEFRFLGDGVSATEAKQKRRFEMMTEINRTVTNNVFPKVFGLRGFTGVFRVDAQKSYMNDDNRLMIVVQRKTSGINSDDRPEDRWEDFTKGTSGELWGELVILPSHTRAEVHVEVPREITLSSTLAEVNARLGGRPMIALTRGGGDVIEVSVGNRATGGLKIGHGHSLGEAIVDVCRRL